MVYHSKIMTMVYFATRYVQVKDFQYAETLHI